MEPVLNTYKRVLQLNVQKRTKKLGWFMLPALSYSCSHNKCLSILEHAGSRKSCVMHFGEMMVATFISIFGEIDLDMLYSCSIVFSSISWPSRRRRHISKSIHHPTGDILAILNVHHSWVELFLENHPTRDIFCPNDHCWREMFFCSKTTDIYSSQYPYHYS